ncbi:MAG TPA: hypothetical protein VNP96_06660 [Solirubrobacterales bacterium]|nr:hypothetical protein [Solirubrobacterales bacterium]
MTRTSTAQRIALLAVVASLALTVAPATGLGAAPVKFGAKLDRTVQPSNSLPGLMCSQTKRPLPCTYVQNEAYGRPDGGELAPRSGTIRKIRLIAGGPGIFRLQVAKVKRSTLFGSNELKVVALGPKLFHFGQSEADWESGNYRVETFDVDVPVKKGQQLAIRTSGTSMLRCSSGGDNTLIYQGSKYPRQPFSPATDTDGCWLLMEAVIR